MASLLLLQVAQAQIDTSRLSKMLGQEKAQFGGRMAVMVWRDSILFQKATGEDFTVNTQDNAGCSSAWFTAALVMTFVDQGKISLDDKVSKYLPVYATYAKKYLTIRHCLANVTGLAGEKGGVERFFQKKKFETLEDEVNAYASGREIVNNPGEAFNYNDVGTNIAGRVLEVVGKKNFDRLAMERIFRPCGMKKTSFASDRAINPFSGAVSTAADYLKFLQMLRNKGTLNGKKVLSEASVAEMQKMQTGSAKTVFVPKLVEGESYGLGNWIQGGGIFNCPGLSACWPWINVPKNYVCIIFGTPKDKENKKVFSDIIDAVDGGL
ncbi:MAG: beta-lactamase family protein [Chitinophagaceae bacterium]|nr:beta-lactamase family protein [Chitinophagaceae bacterium]